tara:strand:+ start:2381 stop:2716 length:336 start_codon:yes stop_codon:yes gene_type:complete
MAIFSSHLLDATNGSHAGNVEVVIFQIKKNGEKKLFYETKSDSAGRINQEFELSKDDCKCEYEMICKTGKYFSEKKIISEINIKFRMEDQNQKYHIPIIISKNSYTVWWSK